jgi:membrane associated rhomboid family serine protease
MGMIVYALLGAVFGFLGGLAGSKKPAVGDKMKTAATAAICAAIVCALAALIVPEILDGMRD